MVYSPVLLYYTASCLGVILHQKPTTLPDAIDAEHSAAFFFLLYCYRLRKRNLRQFMNTYCTMPTGLLISEIRLFLGVTPDSTVYDPSYAEHPFEVKCPYIHRDHTPLNACVPPGICCIAETPHPDYSPVLQLQCKHSYFAQVQGQMTVRGRRWCEFVIFTNRASMWREWHLTNATGRTLYYPNRKPSLTIAWVQKLLAVFMH